MAVNDVTSWDAAFAELAEYVPDLMWPQSVYTYGQMRTDPQLRSVLQAYSLPICRAAWSVDGTGCRPEVARFVADNLGLTVAGDDQSRPRRGPVRFSEVVRLGLLHLVFGHMPLQKVYDVSDGSTARLSRLHERMPSSIYRINLDSQDDLLSIEQWKRGKGDNPPIPREHLVWFAHEREGGAWQGRSLLRPAYGAWLMKRELWRVNATSLRRNGMGVPTVTAPSGATPAQVLEAQRLASAHRVGDQSGVGLPPGFVMELKGITGSVPDPLPFIKYLDQQMTKAALAGVVDLGDTSNGSRALGDTFVDLLMLALGAVADDMAETLTADVSADLVALNWGPDEPVPVVTVGDVGSSYEVTAATLQLLLGSGALSADPSLEAYVRERWKLPTLEAPAPAPVPEVPAPVDPPVEATIPALRIPGKTPPVAAAPASKGWPFRRQLTEVEARSARDVVGLDRAFTATTTTLVEDWRTKYAPLVTAALVAAVAAAYDDGDVTALADLRVDPPAGMVDAVGDAAVEAADAAAADQVTAASKQGVDASGDPAVDELAVRAFAGAMAALLVRAWTSSAARSATAAWPSATSSADVTGAVQAQLESLTDAQASELLGAAVAQGQGSGTSAALATLPEDTATYTASEVMDAATCGPCAAIDGTTFASLEEADAAYASGGYGECEGGLRCRGIVVTTWP